MGVAKNVGSSRGGQDASTRFDEDKMAEGRIVEKEKYRQWEGKCKDEEVTQKSSKRNLVSCNSFAEKHLFLGTNVLQLCELPDLTSLLSETFELLFGTQ